MIRAFRGDCETGKGDYGHCGNDLLSQMDVLTVKPHMRADAHRQSQSGHIRSPQRGKTIQTTRLQARWPMVRRPASLIRGFPNYSGAACLFQCHSYSGAIVWRALFQSSEPERMDMKEFMFWGNNGWSGGSGAVRAGQEAATRRGCRRGDRNRTVPPPCPLAV